MDCPFCARIDAGEYDTVSNPAGLVSSFEPLNPVVPGHRLFVPFTHVTDAADSPWLAGAVFASAAEWARELGHAFNLITSAGAPATQTVRHLHVHYVPRVEGDGLRLPWSPDPVQALRAWKDQLPPGHHERPGAIRAIEVAGGLP